MKRVAKKGAKKPQRISLASRVASISVERNGARIQIDDVPADYAGTMLGELLKAFRTLTKQHPELIVELSSVGGGSPIEANDGDEYAEREKRVGF